VGDFNHDGRPDLRRRQSRLESHVHHVPDSRFGIWAGSFTGNQQTDIVLTEGRRAATTQWRVSSHWARRSIRSRCSSRASRRFPPRHGQIFRPAQLKRALHYETDTFASLYLQNNGNGTFTATPLPNLAQISPIRGIVATDVDGDGNLDLIVAGNLYETEPNTPRADAGNGLWLRGDGRGHFTPVPPAESGFLAPLNVAGLALIETPTGSAVLVANSGDSLSAYAIRRARRPRP